jgi:hypothetical protein
MKEEGDLTKVGENEAPRLQTESLSSLSALSAVPHTVTVHKSGILSSNCGIKAFSLVFKDVGCSVSLLIYQNIAWSF